MKHSKLIIFFLIYLQAAFVNAQSLVSGQKDDPIAQSHYQQITNHTRIDLWVCSPYGKNNAGDGKIIQAAVIKNTDVVVIANGSEFNGPVENIKQTVYANWANDSRIYYATYKPKELNVKFGVKLKKEGVEVHYTLKPKTTEKWILEERLTNPERSRAGMISYECTPVSVH